VEDETNSSARTIVDALPEVIIRQEKENGDMVMCTICRETFSNGESAK
jgi:hypothetical protein